MRIISPTDTAKLIRKALKDAFPGQKFSVKTSKYAGGASVRVRWTDGPRKAAVEPIVSQFEGGRFDGMIDLAYSVTHWMLPDGSVVLAHNNGTEGSRGSHPASGTATRPEGAEMVRFGAKYIFADRDLSDETGAVAEAEAWMREHLAIDKGTTPDHDRFGNYWVKDLARGLAFDREDGDDWKTVFDRRY